MKNDSALHSPRMQDFSHRKKLDHVDVVREYRNEMMFQILDIKVMDSRGKSVVYLFGCTKKGHSVCLLVSGFKPFFYFRADLSVVDAISDKLKSKRLYCDFEIVKRKKFYGFCGDDIMDFVRVSFSSSKDFKDARFLLKDGITVDGNTFDIEMYEDGINSVLQFVHKHNIKACGWVSIDVMKLDDMAKRSNTQICYAVDIKDVTIHESRDVAPFYQMSYDIECYSSDPDKFPSASNDDDAVIQIGATFQAYGESKVKQVIYTLKQCEDIEKDNVAVRCFKSEKRLLEEFSKLILEADPDVIYSYNGYRFDDSYLVERAQKNRVKDFLKCTKLDNFEGNLSSKTFSSSAYGTSEWKYMSLIGRINFDVYIYINREYKLDSYTMDNVAKHFLEVKLKECVTKVSGNRIHMPPQFLRQCHVGQLITLHDELSMTPTVKIEEVASECIVVDGDVGDFEEGEAMSAVLTSQKNAMPAKTLFRYYKEGNPGRIKEIAEYCLQDTLIPLLLNKKLNIFLNQIQMSIVTYVPLAFILERGQQIKVFSQIMKETYKRGYVLPSIRSTDENFEGATVLEPVTGAYFQPVFVLDFESLYPSIIRAHNLCYSTIVLDEKYDDLEGYEYETVEWRDGDSVKKYKYVQNIDAVLPTLLKDLIEERKRVKKQMKTETDEFVSMVLNGFQLALKVSANSIYGFLSAQMLQCRPIGATTTALGRRMICQTKEYINKNFPDFKTVYGDSVTADTPVIVKHNGKICVKRIDGLVDSAYKPYGDKEHSEVDMYTWSANGWNRIVRVIRHKTRKRIFRVRTTRGVVHVTEDHSLLDSTGEKIRPTQCIARSTNLLHNKLDLGIHRFDGVLHRGAALSLAEDDVQNDVREPEHKSE